MPSTKIDKETIEKIKQSRKENKLTQKDIANFLGISLTKYQRFESGFYDKFEEKLVKKLIEKFKIVQENIQTEEEKPSVKISCRITNEYYNYLKTLQLHHHFQNFSEVINYVIEDYFTNLNLSNVKYEIEDIIKKCVLTSWATTLSEQNIEVKTNQKFLDYIIETYDINEKEERKNFNKNELVRKNRSKW